MTRRNSGQRVFRVPAIYTDALPRLCQGKGCYNDPSPGRLYCVECQQAGKNVLEYKRISRQAPARDLPYVYFIQAGEGGPIKIGVTHNIKARLDGLQTANPFKLKVLAYFQCHATVEKELHLAFFDIRLEGEWFEPREDLITFIERSVSGEISWGRWGPNSSTEFLDIE